MDVSAATWNTLSKLLDEALDLDPAARATWLEQIAAAQPDLLPSLNKLLAAHARSETADLLQRLPEFKPSAPGAASDDNALKTGAAVGPYRLLRELGSGGMADVWLAERADGAFERKVALKLPRVTRLRRDLAARFARERDILARLEHPNIARLYDAGIAADGLPYLAMEYVDGQPITTYCDDRRLDVKARLTLFLQVLDAIQYAHANLVIHRDLKPSNVLVTSEGQVRLLDFGIAKLLGGDDIAQETQLTQLAGRALTPDYASPEQIKGEPLTTATDIYSLGVVLYELLTGNRPYELRRRSAAELEEAIVNADVRGVSNTVQSPQLKRALRGDIDAILNQLLRKHPGERYTTATALAEDLQRYLHGFAVRARPEGRLYAAGRFIRRNRLVVAAASAVVTALGIGLAVALWQAQIARQNLTRTERTLERESASRDLYFEAFSTMAAWDAEKFAEPRSVIKLLHHKLEELEQRYHAQPEQRLALLHLVATQLPYLGDHEGSRQISQRYLKLLWASDPHPSHLLDAYKQLARTEHNLGLLTEAEATLREAIAKVPRQDQAPLQRARVDSQLGEALLAQGRRAEAQTVLAQAARSVDGTGQKEDTLWELLRRLAATHLGHDDPEALRVMQRAHDGVLHQSNAQSVQQGVSYLGLASALVAVGRPAEAEAALREGAKRFETMYGAVDRDTVLAVARLAYAIAAQGRYDEARQLLVQRRRMVEQRPGSDTDTALQTLSDRQLEVELLHGDLAAAATFMSKSVSNVASTLTDKSVRPLAEARYLQWAGQADAAASRLALKLGALPPQQLDGATAYKLRAEHSASQWLAGRKDVALSAFNELLTSMRQSGSTKNWTFQETAEYAAVAMIEAGGEENAAALLDMFDQRPTADRIAPASSADRIDSALRRATVRVATEQRKRAAELLDAVRTDIDSQHPDSPRRLAAQRLLKGVSSGP